MAKVLRVLKNIYSYLCKLYDYLDKDIFGCQYGYINVYLNRYVEGYVEGYVDGYPYRYLGRYLEGYLEGYLDRISICIYISI